MKPCAPYLRRTFLGPSHHPSSCLWFSWSQHFRSAAKRETKTQQDVCFDCHKATGINSHAHPRRNNGRRCCTAAQESHPAVLDCCISSFYLKLFHFTGCMFKWSRADEHNNQWGKKLTLCSVVGLSVVKTASPLCVSTECKQQRKDFMIHVLLAAHWSCTDRKQTCKLYRTWKLFSFLLS